MGVSIPENSLSIEPEVAEPALTQGTIRAFPSKTSPGHRGRLYALDIKARIEGVASGPYRLYLLGPRAATGKKTTSKRTPKDPKDPKEEPGEEASGVTGRGGWVGTTMINTITDDGIHKKFGLVGFERGGVGGQRGGRGGWGKGSRLKAPKSSRVPVWVAEDPPLYDNGSIDRKVLLTWAFGGGAWSLGCEEDIIL